MQFDDRLATVLSATPAGDAARRTQLRQLVDLLGSMGGHETGARLDEAYDRLDDLLRLMPGAVQSAVIREPGLRLRNPVLIEHLAGSEPQAAAAAMATARLTEEQWQALIPRIPMVARGFLRHRRDLPPGAVQVLRQLGVQDMVLPSPPMNADGVAPAPMAKPGNSPGGEEPDIAELVRRIESFQRSRRTVAARPANAAESIAPHPLREQADGQARAELTAFDFSTDAGGVICRADPAMAPLVAGLPLSRPSGPLDDATGRAMRLHRPVTGAIVHLEGPPAVAGEWHMDAVPLFCPVSGTYSGHCGRMRRPPMPAPATVGSSGSRADRVRQLLHELRTPVGAIQGFAEIIQQQLFGPVPNEYRALAAAVAVDAARLLAGFDDMDRLARLETAALPLPPGTCDLRNVTEELLRRLEGVLRPRGARIDMVASGQAFTVPLHRDDAQLAIWRIVATMAGAMAPGETLAITLHRSGNRVLVDCEMPRSMADAEDIFTAAAPAQSRAVSAGMFGTGFTLRLARAEARAAGGLLERRANLLTLSLPIAEQNDATQPAGSETDGSKTIA